MHVPSGYDFLRLSNRHLSDLASTAVPIQTCDPLNWHPWTESRKAFRQDPQQCTWALEAGEIGCRELKARPKGEQLRNVLGKTAHIHFLVLSFYVQLAQCLDAWRSSNLVTGEYLFNDVYTTLICV